MNPAGSQRSALWLCGTAIAVYTLLLRVPAIRNQPEGYVAVFAIAAPWPTRGPRSAGAGTRGRRWSSRSCSCSAAPRSTSCSRASRPRRVTCTSGRARRTHAARRRRRPVSLADYRGKKPVVLVFYRGYW